MNYLHGIIKQLFLDDSYANNLMNSATLVYSPYQLEIVRKQRICEGKTDRCINDEHESKSSIGIII